MLGDSTPLNFGQSAFPPLNLSPEINPDYCVEPPASTLHHASMNLSKPPFTLYSPSTLHPLHLQVKDLFSSYHGTGSGGARQAIELIRANIAWFKRYSKNGLDELFSY